MQTTYLKSLRETYQSITGPLGEGASTDILLVVLASAVAKAIERWPSYGDHTDELVKRVAAVAGGEAGASETVAQLEIADLLLAVAALAGDKPAIETLEKTIRHAIRPVLLRRLRSDAVRIDEASQHTVVKVLFGEEAGRQPRLGGYAARGPLTAWVRMVAVRVALDAVSKDAPEDVDSSLVEAALVSSEDPEMRVVLTRYAPIVTEAIRAAVNLLTDRERTLLCWSMVNRLSIDQIGSIYGCHRSTANRWIQAATQQLIKLAEQQFATRAGASTTDFYSLWRAMPAYMEETLGGLLVGKAKPETTP